MLVSLFGHQGRSTQDSAILDSSQCNNALWMPTKKILQTTTYDEEQVSESVVTKLASLILKLCSLRLSLILENEGHASLPLKVFRIESWGEIPIRGEGCNTLGVCHQLSNGFKLKHDMLSGDESFKIKSTK